MIKSMIINCVIALAFICCVSEASIVYMTLEKLFKGDQINSVVVGLISDFEKHQVESTQKIKNTKNEYFYRNFKKLILDAKIVQHVAGNSLGLGNLTLTYIEPFDSYKFELLPDGKRQNSMNVLEHSWTGSGKEFNVNVQEKKILFLGKSGDNYTLLRIEPFTDEMVKYVGINGPVSDL